jgi:hypothetical protein
MTRRLKVATEHEKVAAREKERERLMKQLGKEADRLYEAHLREIDRLYVSCH